MMCDDLCDGQDCIVTRAANALSTLQSENAELQKMIEKYATTARVIALHLNDFCDRSLPYDEMIADAARKAAAELEQVKAERDAAEQCIFEIEDALDRGNDNDWARQSIERWEIGQKED